MTLPRFAAALSTVTFALLLVGALVHGTGSGLACPDWPLCFGSALPRMTGHVLYEHSHRLLAGTVALGTVALAVWIAIAEGRAGRRRLTWMGFGAVGLVLVQAVLGGLTVLLKLPAIVSTAHLAVSMLFFALTLYLAAATRPGFSPSWRLSLGRTERALLATTTLALYAQVILGAVVRHTGSGLACFELTLCQGQALPLGAHPSVLLQATHRLWAMVVSALVVATAVRLARAARGRHGLVRGLATAAPLLVGAQVALGVLSVWSYLGLVIVTAHLGVAALLVATHVGLWLSTRSTAAAELPAAGAVTQGASAAGAAT